MAGAVSREQRERPRLIVQQLGEPRRDELVRRWVGYDQRIRTRLRMRRKLAVKLEPRCEVLPDFALVAGKQSPFGIRLCRIVIASLETHCPIEEVTLHAGSVYSEPGIELRGGGRRYQPVTLQKGLVPEAIVEVQGNV